MGERTKSVHVPHVVVTVGLPARGKTYMAKKLARYLNWTGIKTRVFNVGEYRRQATTQYKSHDFFRPDNQEAMAIRVKCALDALEDVRQWLDESGEVAVFDATNTTRERRRMIFDICTQKLGYKCFFVESICDKEEIVESNILEVKLTSPDYLDCDKETALQDFLKRIDHYKDCYQTIDEVEEAMLSFIKIFNAGEKVLVHKHEGHLQARIVYYLMNIHITPRTIYLTRHGESEYNQMGKIGGNSRLSVRGEKYSTALADYIHGQAYCIVLDRLCIVLGGIVLRCVALFGPRQGRGRVQNAQPTFRVKFCGKLTTVSTKTCCRPPLNLVSILTIL